MCQNALPIDPLLEGNAPSSDYPENQGMGAALGRALADRERPLTLDEMKLLEEGLLELSIKRCKQAVALKRSAPLDHPDITAMRSLLLKLVVKE